MAATGRHCIRFYTYGHGVRFRLLIPHPGDEMVHVRSGPGASRGNRSRFRPGGPSALRPGFGVRRGPRRTGIRARSHIAQRQEQAAIGASALRSTLRSASTRINAYLYVATKPPSLRILCRLSRNRSCVSASTFMLVTSNPPCRGGPSGRRLADPGGREHTAE